MPDSPDLPRTATPNVATPSIARMPSGGGELGRQGGYSRRPTVREGGASSMSDADRLRLVFFENLFFKLDEDRSVRRPATAPPLLTPGARSGRPS